MGHRFQPGALVGLGEDDGAQPAPIEPAIGVEHLIAEMRGDLGQGRLAGLDDLAGHVVGIDPRHAVGGEGPGDGALAGGDAAGHADGQGAVHDQFLMA